MPAINYQVGSLKSWAEIYAQEIEKAGGYEQYLHIKLLEKKPLIDRIIKYTPPIGRILEAGCGTGVISTYLSNIGFQVTAIDVDEEMLCVARKIAKRYPHSPNFEKRSIFDLDYPIDSFDLIFSHGVLEHFCDEDILRILANQLRISSVVIISVPSNYFREKDRMFGDERFLSRKRWETLLDRVPGQIVEKFSFHYLRGWARFWDTVIRGKLFGPAPYLAFVLRKIG